MEHEPSKERNYWQLLDTAQEALDGGDFAAAEHRFLEADRRREASPGRVFLTETIADGLARLLRRRRDERAAAGRWERRAAAFREAFLAAGEQAVREGVRLAELRPEDDADANQPVLEGALFLVVRSRLFPEEFGSAVPLMKGLFRTAARTGRVFDVQLVRHDVPLTEEDRLWLARRGSDVLEAFVEQGRVVPASGAAREWAAALLQLLHPRYFGASGRLAEERAWLEAVTADRLLGDAEASVRLYRGYLETSPEPGPRADEARVRTLELLANVDGPHFPVPRYAEALGALQSAGLAPGSEQAGRYGTAVARLEYRRPEAEPGAEPAAWASAALDADGAVTIVLWWHGEPRDLARWAPGESAAALDAFLEPCGGRVLVRDVATLAAAGEAWADGPAPWPVGRFVEILAEPDLPRGGLDDGALRRLAAGEAGPWRAGWRRELGRPELAPLEDWDADPRAGTGLGRALLTGLVMLGLRRRVAGGDPSLRAGLAELARRGDRAAAVLHGLLTVGDEAARAMDAAFAAWTVPLLWTRPDPFSAGGGAAAAEATAAGRPDLGRNDVAVVSSGDPAGVLAAWGAGRGRWRVVLDRLERLAGLAPALAGVIGPVTVIPPDGRVHRLDAALALLDELVRRRPDLARSDDPDAGLLAVFHWVRVVTTHNGDLLDFRTVRPWRPGAFPLYDRYAAAVAELPREAPRLPAGGDEDGWGPQFAQRARKAGFVAGHADRLDPADPGFDGLWGVFEGSDASWVFLDAAAVHARLTDGGRRDPACHRLLVPRGHRHLSVLTGAVWCREDLEELVARWLAPYGPAYRLALTDLRPPALLLADRGAVPGGRHLGPEALAAALAHVTATASAEQPRTVLAPVRGTGAEFWAAAVAGRFAVPGAHWTVAEESQEAPQAGGAVLVVPELAALDAEPAPAASGGAAGWREADDARAERAAEARRRCSLEIAAHLAGDWEAVEILDARWWRLLRGQPPAPESGAAGAGTAGGGAAAAAAATAGRARCVDLPETGGEARRRLEPTLAAEVAAWAAARGLTAPEDATPAWPRPGRRLEVAPPEPARRALLAAVARAWERGRVEAWVLLVAAEPWPAAAAVVAEAAAAGCSVWPAGDRPPAPVLWARPRDLADPALAAYVARHRPAAVLVPDLEAWLPHPGRAAQPEAAALRTLLGLDVPALALQARRLSAPWRRFLAAATDMGIGAAPQDGDDAQPVVPPSAPRSATLVARLRRLLGRLRPLLVQAPDAAVGDRGGPDLDGELVPTARLAALAGLAPEQVRDAVLVLRWAARLAGDPLAAAGEEAGDAPVRERTHALVVRERFAVLEARLDQLAEALAVLPPLWLGRLPAGGESWLDLAQPPARIEPEVLDRLDTWLLGGGAAGCGLRYTAPRGVLGSSRRLAAVDRPVAEVVAAAQAQLDLFRRRVGDVMAGAVETGAGFLVETGLGELRPDERAFLALGAALGFWRWFGPPGPHTLPLVDLLSAAESRTARGGDGAWTLVGELGGRPDPSPDAEQEPSGRSPAGGLRALFGHGEAEGPDAAAVAAVANLAGEAPEPVFLVLRGLAGSGRTAAAVAGLARAARRAADPGEVTVFCPDAHGGAALARCALREGLALDLRLPVEEDLPEPAAGAAATAAGTGVRDDVVVMTEVQRFAPEVRYRIAQHGRGRRLLLTVDPAAAEEPWENLFLTTPRAADVLTLDEQRDQARRLWEQVRGLVPEPLAGRARGRRRARGTMAAEYAANLDQGAARIVAARADGSLPARLRLTAPLASDLDYLAGALRAQGWLAVAEDELDALALPGPCDLLAAAADVLAAAGALRPGSGAAAPEGAAPEPAADDAAEASPPDGGLLAALPRGEAPPPAWPPEPLPDLRAETLADLAFRLLAAPDAAPALRRPAARRRVYALLARWGERLLADLPGEPAWQAWWTELLGDLGRPDPAPDRPLVRLAPSGSAPAVPVPGAVYLCLGGEDPRQHYRILARTADAALVLYQDRSPFAER